MKYLNEILWLLSWPLLIYFSYKLCEYAIRRFRPKEGKSENENDAEE